MLFSDKHTFYIMTIAGFLMFTACGEEREDLREEGRTLDYTTPVHFLSESDTVTTILAAVADSEVERSTGLMNVYEMPMENGMLFIFEEEEPRSFWMANTPLALDIIFADSDGEIVRIQRNTNPWSEENVNSEHPARYVVETNAGFAMRHDLQEGMQITFEAP